MTDADLAQRLHRDLAALAADAGWSPAATEGQPQGHYSDPIADACADVGVADLAAATVVQRKRVRQLALSACLERLELHYAAQADLKVGQRDEKLSQISAALGRIRASAPAAGGGVAQGFTLRRGPAVDYTTGGGDDA
jgi:hypothetical protein